MRVITALFLLWMTDGAGSDVVTNNFPPVSKGLGNSFYQESQKPPVDWKNFFNFTRYRPGVRIKNGLAGYKLFQTAKI